MEVEDLLLYAFVLILYFVLHSVLADLRVKNFLIGRWISKRYYRLSYNFLALGLLLPIAWLYSQVISVLLFENIWLSYLGGFLVVLGLALLGLALRQYDLSEFSGMQQLKSASSPPTNELNRTGFNSIVRHPLYFSSLLILWGWYLFRPTDVFLVTAVISTLYLYVGTKLEEQKLILEYGTTYKEYQKKVAMLIPFVI